MASATPDLQLPSQLQSITTHWLIPNYTAWWQRHTCVNNLPRVALDSEAAGIIDHKSGTLPLHHRATHNEGVCGVKSFCYLNGWVSGQRSHGLLLGLILNPQFTSSGSLYYQFVILPFSGVCTLRTALLVYLCLKYKMLHFHNFFYNFHSALTLLVERQEGHLVSKKSCSSLSIDSSLEHLRGFGLSWRKTPRKMGLKHKPK